ncbi:MAG: lipopolysaccharide biosynthesis protein [Flavobacteriales bacterium]
MRLKKRFKGDFSRNVIQLSFFTALSQAIPFLVLPFLQRYFYTPYDFGLFSSFTAFSSVIIAFASLKFELAIVMEEQEKVRFNLLAIGLISVFAIAFALLIFGFLLPEQFSQLARFPASPWLLVFLSLSVIGFAGSQVLNYWQNQQKQFKKIGQSKLIQNAAGESVKVISGILQFQAIGLIAGRAIGHFLGFIWLCISVLFNIKAKLMKQVSVNGMRSAAHKHRHFLYFSMPSALLGTFANNLHILIPQYYYERAEIGLIGAAFIYIAVPAGIISGSFSQVFYQRISELKTKSDLLHIYWRFVKQLFLIAIPSAVLLQIIPNSWIGSLLGDSWQGIMPYAKVMAPYLACMFVSSAVSFIYIRLNRQKQMLGVDIIRVALSVISILIGHQLYHDPMITIMFYSAAQIISYLIAIAAAIFFIKNASIPE